MPFLARPNPNGESTNKSPVPCLPVSWNRSSSLPVYFEQRPVGTIDVDKSGPCFTYDPGWLALRGAFPISTTMPLKPERIGSDIFLPWAANLLPESEQLRTLGQLLGMARGDVIGLLSAIGGDTAGARLR